jgi:hypothetical protein
MALYVTICIACLLNESSMYNILKSLTITKYSVVVTITTRLPNTSLTLYQRFVART